MSATSHNRIIWIDYVKAMAITIVVLLHLGIPDPFRTIVRSFVIPLFFILSGIFSHPDKYPTWKCFLQNKTFRLFVPYVVFNTITYFYWLVIGRNMGADSVIFVPWWKPIIGTALGLEHWMVHCKPLWFLPCLMVAEVLFYSCYRALKTKSAWLLLIMLILFVGGIALSKLQLPPLPYAVGGAMSMILFYYCGYLLNICTNGLQKLQDMVSHSTIFWFLSCVVAIFGCIWLSLQTTETRVFENVYGNLLYALPAACCGCIGVSTLCILLYKLLPTIKILSYFGTHTMIILAFHLMIASFVKGFTYFVLHLPLDIYSVSWVKLLFAIVILLLSIPVCYLYDWVQKKWK